jgi:hypothetical protein
VVGIGIAFNVIPGRREAANPESILRSISSQVQGLWIPALASLGRNDTASALAPYAPIH